MKSLCPVSLFQKFPPARSSEKQRSAQQPEKSETCLITIFHSLFLQLVACKRSFWRSILKAFACLPLTPCLSLFNDFVFSLFVQYLIRFLFFFSIYFPSSLPFPALTSLQHPPQNRLQIQVWLSMMVRCYACFVSLKSCGESNSFFIISNKYQSANGQ